MAYRLATYECRCCARRMHRWFSAGERAAKRMDCTGWCPRCGGSCAGRLHQTSIARSEPAQPMVAPLR